MPTVETTLRPSLALLGPEKIAMTKLEDHPLAAIFPILEGDAFTALVEDVKANRLQEPIVLCEGKILDGRNRYRACTLEKVMIKARDYQGNDPIGFVLSANLHRRHLDENQRAIVGANLAKYELGANQHAGKKEGLPVGIAAELLNVGARSIARAKKILPFPALVVSAGAKVTRVAG